nr:peptidase M28 [Chryseobacterium sp.]
MRYFTKIALLTVAVSVTPLCAQQKDPMIDHIMNETYQNSQLEQLAYELIDGIGPRLVGSPKMQQAHDWAVQRFQNWGIAASNEQWGEWKSWERGTSSIEMVAPYIKSLEGMQLAFSPKTPAKGITAEVVALPLFQSKAAFEAWLPKVKGKFVMVSQYQASGRPEYNWKEFATAESFERYKAATAEANLAWNRSMENIGHTWRSLNKPFEEAGAAGIIWSNWSRGF